MAQAVGGRGALNASEYAGFRTYPSLVEESTRGTRGYGMLRMGIGDGGGVMSYEEDGRAVSREAGESG